MDEEFIEVEEKQDVMDTVEIKNRDEIYIQEEDLEGFAEEGDENE